MHVGEYDYSKSNGNVENESIRMVITTHGMISQCVVQNNDIRVALARVAIKCLLNSAFKSNMVLSVRFNRHIW